MFDEYAIESLLAEFRTKAEALGATVIRVGSELILLSEPAFDDRSVGILTPAHFALCATTALVASLDGAVLIVRQLTRTAGGAFSTLMTGPSRTADTERVLTVGVQGQGKVMTHIVDDLREG